MSVKHELFITTAIGDEFALYAEDGAHAASVLKQAETSAHPIRFVSLRAPDGAIARLNLAHVMVITYREVES